MVAAPELLPIDLRRVKLGDDSFETGQTRRHDRRYLRDPQGLGAGAKSGISVEEALREVGPAFEAPVALLRPDIDLSGHTLGVGDA
jgi:hypothetical protein